MTIIRIPKTQARQMKGMIALIAVLVVFVILFRIIGLITDWFWFQEVGYETIFTVTLLAKIKTGALFGAGFFLILYANLLIAMRLSRAPLFGDMAGGFDLPIREMTPAVLKILILMGSLLIGLFAAANGSAQWEKLLLFLNPSPFGVTDPIFEKDIGFYVFQFPFLLHLFGWLKFVLIVTAAAILLLVAANVLGRGIYPSLIQKLQVIPNEIVAETPYLEKNIRYTRLAYGLTQIEEQEFPTEENLTAKDLEKNNLTVKNIRLWDHAPLLQTYSQLQEMRTYYKFTGVDNDRYTIDGEYRQIMLSPREISYPALPSRTWVNEHLAYTHGYGVVVGPVNRVSGEGLPEFFIKDIPPVSMTSLKVTRPEIYFGENSNDYVFVRTKMPEFDYPVGDKNVYSRYEGKGGVPLSRQGNWGAFGEELKKTGEILLTLEKKGGKAK